jgi:mannitol/fructose-specific phosphotransferase system IIA component (Ntr-type)
VGVALGDSTHLRERTRATIDHFASFIFAPVFFASIGLKVDFLAHIDIPLVLTVLVIACVCKIAGGTLGAKWGGMPSRDSWAVGFAMNSRGAMEIILGLLALEAGIIRHRLFVALVVMAIITSMMSGPAIWFLLRQGKRRSLQKYLSAKLFLRDLKATTNYEAIHEMIEAASATTGLNLESAEKAVHDREETLSTGVGNGLALPHARLVGLRELIVVVGISESGIDFDAPDGRPANLVLLLLSPADDSTTQLEILAEISRIVRDQNLLDRVLRTKNFTDFLALINSSATD